MKDYLIQFALLRERAFREPNNRTLFRQLLLCTEMIGNHAESRELYESVLDEHPYCSYAWYNLGWACVQLEAPEVALEAFEYAYITQPYFEEAYLACAELAVQRGLHRRALQCYLEMNAHAEADSEVLVRMGECYLELGDVRMAKKLCRRALRLDPYHAEAYFRLGTCFAAVKDYRPAARWLRQALRLEERREEFHLALAIVYNGLGQAPQALVHFRRSVDLAPEEPAAWLHLAEFLLFSGDLAQAKEVLEQALEHASGAELLYCWAACQFLSGDRTNAVRTLRQALSADVSRHPDIFRWAPALRDDVEIQGLLSSYQ
ncbi:MAG: tetratricopeptide repeat protein [Saprospiraceae bacterium]|nr:tetratricopeptide repeat protein [Saprospiraceae bacterium]